MRSRGSYQPADPEAMNVPNAFSQSPEEWPQRGPFTMARWREAIVKCAAFPSVSLFPAVSTEDTAAKIPATLSGQIASLLKAILIFMAARKGD